MSDHIHFQDGEFKGTVIGKAEYRQEAPAPTALDALPPRAAGFTGRDGELGRLLDVLNPACSSGAQAVLVTAVSGLGGIGKTTLAVESAYAAREAGWYPGGVIFVDLHGYDDVPVTADQALQLLLRALGVEPQHIPAVADERAGLYRSLLAGRDALLVLADNASSPDQIWPLLPGGNRHRILVTSRDRLPQLDARLLPLDQLGPPAAYDLLDRALRIADPDDSRIGEEAEAAGRLAGLCGHLPLALQIAAALLAEDPGMSVADLVDELTTSYDRLAALDDGHRSIRAAFDLSYRRLPPGQARLLRLLALAPGPEVSDEVAAALVGADVLPLRDLRGLARANLVERGSGRGRWRLHDLVRAFGVGVVAGDAGLREEGEAARARVLEFYLRWASRAEDRLRWVPGMPEPERFADRRQALAWLDGERAGLVAAALWAREERYAAAAVRLAASMTLYLYWRRYFDDWLTTSHAAQGAAHDIGDHRSEAFSWNNLGYALREIGRVEEAIDAHTRARDLYQALDDVHGEASAWDLLGYALREVGRAGEAIDAHTRARDVYQALDNLQGEAEAWDYLGLALRDVGRVGEAIDAHIRSRDLEQATGDRHREGVSWHNLGLALLHAGRVEEAIEAYGKDLEICRELEDWYRAGQTLEGLARAHQSAHHSADTYACLLQAADAYNRAGAPAEAANARAQAAALTAPEKPTDKPTPASPPAHKPAPAQPSPPPPDAPGTAER
ncbi:tetratricopeptide repeat protein [Streptomyces sp. Ag109_G2-15]|uniref:tetratricopeptide repeat protein n=1 Tax=Streptomyces sp. Ag109_G2-15 TaxID=1938850 RepID=UPI000BD54F25|nr:tetratricopeptide repeat protein [Streptomyces sp. Ag109_G2-15]SOD83603.1 Predicted ATPase [Streptomyces sp. Ag109_G2-15]